MELVTGISKEGARPAGAASGRLWRAPILHCRPASTVPWRPPHADWDAVPCDYLRAALWAPQLWFHLEVR